MSETLTDEQAAEVAARRRDPSNLDVAAAEALEAMTSSEEGAEEPEVEPAPSPNQDPVTEQNRAVAAMRAQQAREPAVAENEEPEAEEPEAEIELPPPAPEDWLTEEPDFEAEARAELGSETEADETEEYGAYEDDPRLEQERIKRLAAEKRLAHIEGQRVKEARKSWATEALEHAPLAKYLLGDKLEKIEADSKRSFLKQAAEAHDQMRSALEESLGPATQIVAEEATAAKAEAKAKAEKAYGKPTTGPGAAPAEAGERAAVVAQARERKGLAGAIRALIDQGINP